MNMKKILEDHALWLESEGSKGSRANLRYPNLKYTDLRGANLRCADLRGADLRGVDLRSANLIHADLRSADLSNADLRYTNFRCADLRGADLRGSIIKYSIGNSKEIKTIQNEDYDIIFTSETLAIGCQSHSIAEWKVFSSRDILEMDGKKALLFWDDYKELIFKYIELSFPNSN